MCANCSVQKSLNYLSCRCSEVHVKCGGKDLDLLTVKYKENNVSSNKLNFKTHHNMQTFTRLVGTKAK